MHGPDLLYFASDPWPWGMPHEAARVHHTARQCSGNLAARGACAADGQAAHEAMVGSRRIAARVTWGAISLSSSSHFPLRPYSNVVNPVALPPGRARARDEAGANRIDGHREHDGDD
jgi:hypothetical protein